LRRSGTAWHCHMVSLSSSSRSVASTATYNGCTSSRWDVPPWPKYVAFARVSYSSLKQFTILVKERDLINPLECRGNYSAVSTTVKLVHWPLMGGLLHLVERGGDLAGPQPAHAPPRCTKYNSTPINTQCFAVLQYNVRCSAVLMCPLKG